MHVYVQFTKIDDSEIDMITRIGHLRTWRWKSNGRLYRGATTRIHTCKGTISRVFNDICMYGFRRCCYVTETISARRTEEALRCNQQVVFYSQNYSWNLVRAHWHPASRHISEHLSFFGPEIWQTHESYKSNSSEVGIYKRK